MQAKAVTTSREQPSTHLFMYYFAF